LRRKVTINFLLSYYRLIMPFLNWSTKFHKNEKKKNDSKCNKSLISIEKYARLNENIINSNDKDDESSLSDWSNLLILGNNKYVMLSLLEQFKEKIDLIYIDPPFFTGSEFKYKTFIGANDAFTFSKAYSDSWKGGLDSYLKFIYERLIILKDLLSERGSLYIHLDWHVSHYVKILLDELFGIDNFRNEIIWAYPAASVKTRNFFIRSYDTIFFYTKSNDYVFRDDPNIYMEYSNRVKSSLKRDKKGLFYYRGGSHNGKKLSRKVYVKNNGIFPRDVWNDIPYIRANTNEYQGFSTQKPERLLKRIILASTHESDLVADFFCGTGTTLIAAEKLGRRWIGCDIMPQSIHICRKRILDIRNSNDLFNWTKNYKSDFCPFKILTSRNLNYGFKIPEEFLLNNHQGIQDIVSKNVPDFQVSIKKKGMSIHIILSNYEIPYVEYINPKIANKISNYTDWIDFWAVDFDYKGTYMDCDWTSFRNPKNKLLNINSKTHIYETTGKYTIKIKVINILGQESEKDYQITV